MIGKRQFWLAIALLGLVVASPWMWKRGREAWLAWKWWRGEEDAAQALWDGRILWPFRLACSSRTPERRRQGLVGLAVACRAGQVGMDEVAPFLLAGIRDTGIAVFEDPNKSKGDEPGLPVGAYIPERILDTGYEGIACIFRTHLDELLSDLEDPGLPRETRRALMHLVTFPDESEYASCKRYREKVRLSLGRVLGDPDAMVRLGAAGGIVRFASHDQGTGMFGEAVRTALDLSEHPDPLVGLAVESVLAEALATSFGTPVDRARWKWALERVKARNEAEVSE